MYVPTHFEETRVEVMHELMCVHPFATLVTLTSQGLNANHIPLELQADPAPFGTLRGHIARANPLWRELSSNVNALAIFQGTNRYISPAWYPTKEETGKVVPTWNYAVVHAHGPLKVIEDRDWLRQLVGRLTDHHESNRSQPWSVSDAPADYIEKTLDAIVGLEMPIVRLIGKWKVSQNRPAKDQAGVVENLSREADESSKAMAALIRQFNRIE
jgi:transcriptional regulator